MKTKKSKIAMFLGLLFLATSCSSAVKPYHVDDETYRNSIQYLIKRKDSSRQDYVYRYKELLEKYSTFISEDKKVEVQPTGTHPIEDIAGESKEDIAILLPKSVGGEVRYSIPRDYTRGLYTLELEYYLTDKSVSSGIVSVYVGSSLQFAQATSLELPMLYEDAVEKKENGDKNFDAYVNKYKDQMAPKSRRYGTWNKVSLNTNLYDTADPAIFEIGPENSYISIRSNSSDEIYLKNLTIVPYNPLKDYTAYYSGLTDVQKTLGNGFYKMNATEYAYKDTKSIRLATEMTATVQPFDNHKKMINILQGWDSAGQSATWKFEVSEPGMYPITLHYFNGTNEAPVFRSIYINGEIPFKEFKNYRLNNTGSGYANETLHSGNTVLRYYFEANKTYELTIKSEKEYFAESYNNLMTIYNDINDFAIDIRKLIGVSADSNRPYRLTSYIPETEDILQNYKNVIYYEYNRLSSLVDENSVLLSYFPRMTQLLEGFVKSPNSIPNSLNKFSSGDSCLAKLVADTANMLINTSMTLDMIYLTNNENKIPVANASGWVTFKNSMSSLFDTFTSDRYKSNLNGDELNVWVNRSTNYIEIMQTMADNDFTPKTGIKVNLRQMPGEQNLILANAANQTPDLALGVTSGLAFEFALRGDAAYPLSDFPDFWEYASKVPAGQLMSSLYQDKIYGLPETSTAQVQFVRSDILEILGDSNTKLTIPNTWDDLIDILPKLQIFGMNYYYPASVSSSLKPISATAQMILQNGGKLYADDGYSIDLRNEASLKGLRTLTDLYTVYALPAEIANFFNSFRYGSVPMGIGDVSMYISLKYVAPELVGKWEVTLPPGVKQNCSIEEGTCSDINKDGTPDDVSRWYISNGQTSMIFNKSKRIDDAWTFNKWWMDADTQIEYADTLQSIYGPSFIWFSANVEAAQELLIDNDVRDTVLEAQKWIIDLQQLPGQYMIQRGLSDIWNTVVLGKANSGPMSVANAVDLNKVIMDREIQRKMEEFGFYDTKTKQGIKEYKIRSYDWIMECISNYKNGIKTGNSYSNSCPI